MGHVYCRGCGHQLAVTAVACLGCGAPQPGAVIAAAAPQTATPDADAGWARRFALIDKAGGPKLPQLRTLPFTEILAIKWNLWAFLFGPIYYAVKGMWKKGLTLFGMAMLIVIAGEVLLEAIGLPTSVMLFVGPGILAGQANVSYYRLAKLGYRGWW